MWHHHPEDLDLKFFNSVTDITRRLEGNTKTFSILFGYKSLHILYPAKCHFRDEAVTKDHNCDIVSDG
jgi:hypothetical protein